MATLGVRLASARRMRGMTQTELAVALGDRYSQSMISQVETGRSILLLDGLINAAQELHVSTDYLLGLTDDPTPTQPVPAMMVAGPDPELVRIPREDEVPERTRSSLVRATLETFPFPRALFEVNHIDPKNARIIQVQGQSMYPSMPDGTLILVDYGSSALKNGYCYVVEINKLLLVRRLRQNAEGEYSWTSDFRSVTDAGADNWYSTLWYVLNRSSGDWEKNQSNWEPVEHRSEFIVWGQVRWWTVMAPEDGE